MKDERRVYRQLKEDARAAKAHVSAEHARWLCSGVVNGCESILLAADAISEHGKRLVFIDELYTAIRRAVNQGETMEQLERTAREIWERVRGCDTA
jgi:hypothetical protein